jgi:hypothetical protein
VDDNSPAAFDHHRGDHLVRGQLAGTVIKDDRGSFSQDPGGDFGTALLGRPLGVAKEHFVEYNGKPVLSVKKAFRTVVKLAKIDTTVENVTPHTAATWLMHQGVDLWTAAGYLGMTVEVLERVYGHHHPDHLADAVRGITAKRPMKKAVV